MPYLEPRRNTFPDTEEGRKRKRLALILAISIPGTLFVLFFIVSFKKWIRDMQHERAGERAGRANTRDYAGETLIETRRAARADYQGYFGEAVMEARRAEMETRRIEMETRRVEDVPADSPPPYQLEDPAAGGVSRPAPALTSVSHVYST